ncbi:hypothetical protein FHS27_001313 [Rhodopirellula rubra]|uniref:GmrSD restriction endonucleases N-terminal domain-containing protein n=1 Tax=Aporhodopirellula rubra TaxID=980271 RepID=A0A7W5DWU9_9BACT|nr:DUF262 domain-containing protein [Aporhodopirellula rubra]MBB3205513.1 hypothetical protein [Aporhodopirellula rubra]
MSDIGSQFNYKQLLERHNSIRIPMIQRDYAQGRPSVAQVREDFLAAIEDALNKPPGDPSLPMNLDFIYGSVANEDELSQFSPLDGQQRLTTLYLLHWYLAWSDDRFDDFEDLFRDGDHSRFSYSVRQSSNEFFDALVQCQPEDRPDEVAQLSHWIANQSWYFRSWRLDPTIQSVLSMLDAIHTRFAASEELFERLVSEDHPAITFQLLDLENFELTDDLYIKMNARGKSLSPFETFKARYEQDLSKQFAGESRAIGGHEFPVNEFVARRMDTAWLDLFWSGNRRSAEIVDESFFNVFRLVALITRDPDAASCTKDVLILTRTQPTYATFHDSNWLDETFTRTLIPLLECWSSGDKGLHIVLPNKDYFDERAIFERLTRNSTSLDVSEILLFMAYAFFIREHEPALDADKFQQWMRVIYNLIINVNIERAERLPIGMNLIQRLLPHSGSILEYVQSWEVPDELPMNVKLQLKEEILKAGLLLSHDGWRPLIERAELHGYFDGQIDFALNFSGVVDQANASSIDDWDAPTHVKLQAEFESSLLKAEAMFDAEGLIASQDHLWERALLTVGDYTLESGNRNRSLLVNATTVQGSWKRLLRAFSPPERIARVKLRDLWAKLDDHRPFPDQLLEIIKAGDETMPAWRAAVVKTPQAFSYGKNLMRFENGYIYLLKKMRMSAAHAEVHSFCFFNNELRAMAAKGSLGPLTIGEYADVNGIEREPYFDLIYREGKKQMRIEVDVFEQKYRIGALTSKLASMTHVRDCLEKHGDLVTVDDYQCISIEIDKLKKTLVRLAKDLGEAGA